MASDDFIGNGWAFPAGINRNGSVRLVTGTEEVDAAIRMILSTVPGERVMRPDFGCQIHDLVFAPNDASTAGLASFYVEEALALWEPRIHVLSVRAAPDQESPERLLVHIDYEIKATYDRRTLVFPFYRIPGE